MIQPVKKQRAQPQVMPFVKFPLGEVTAIQPFQLVPQELSECIDSKFNPGGQIQTRDPFTQYTTSVISSIVDIQRCAILDTAGSTTTSYTLCSDEDHIYYINTVTTTAGTTVTPVEIGPVTDDAYITPYNGVALISDGSYLKYCDDINDVKMAYDANGTMFDNYSGDIDGTVAITTSGVGVTFQTIAWDAGYSIPPTTVYWHGAETGGTATITVEIVTTAGGAVSSQVYSGPTSTTPGYYNLTFATVTDEMDPNTNYYCRLKGTNFILSYTTVASGGKMIGDVTKNPVMRVHPGIPPKSEWAVVSGTRPWVFDPDRPGGLWYGNLSHLDWSTTDGGGWLGVIDQDRNSFRVGAAQDLYGTLYVYGTENQPYLCKLTGSEPSEYALPLMFQRAWSTHKNLINTNNDLWAAARDGVDPLTGVQEFGDLRTYSAADPIIDRFSNWTDAAFSGYYPVDGQFWFYMPGYTYISVAHTKQPIRDDKGKVRYPWSRYKPPVTPTCFSQAGDLFLMGSSDGYIYRYGGSGYKDLNTTQISPSFKIAYPDIPFGEIHVLGVQVMATSKTGGTMDVKFYRNGTENVAFLTLPVAMSVSDTIILEDVEESVLADMEDFVLAPEGNVRFFDLNFNCYSFSIEGSEIVTAGQPMFLDGFLIKYRQLEQ